MVSTSNSPRPDRATQWPRRGAFRLRCPIGVEQTLIEEYLRARWQLIEEELAGDDLRRIVEADGELAGALAMARGSVEKSPPYLRSHSEGRWVLKTGTHLDPRLQRRYEPAKYEQLMDLVGPVFGIVTSRRLNLCGYAAVVILSRHPEFSPALGPAAFVQQVEAGAIDEPLLSAHLRYGAQVVALSSASKGAMAIVCRSS